MEAKNATLGQRLSTARKDKDMSQAELSRKTGLTTRAIRYYESDQRIPSAEIIKRIADALLLPVDYFVDEVAFQEQQEREHFLEQAKEQFGSRGKAQARQLLKETSALFAGGELSEDDQAAFMEEMQEIFFAAKSEAKAFTPKKYKD